MAVRTSVLRTIVGLAGLGVLVSGCGGGGVGGREITVEGPVMIERQFQQGESLRYRFKVDSQSGVKRTAYEQSIATQTELKTTNLFTRVTDDEVEMVMRFDYAVGAVTVSDHMQPDETVAELRGKELRFTLSPDGKVLSWTGLTGAEALEAGAGQIAILLYDVFPPLTDRPVEIGSSWTVDFDVPDITSNVDRDFIGETTFTVTGFKEKYEIRCVELRHVTDFEFEGRAEQAGEVWLMSGAGLVEGTMLVSIDAGHIVYGTSQATMNLTGEGASVAGAAATGIVEMGIKSNLAIELL